MLNSYLLDSAEHDWLQRVTSQPYPPRPDGVWVSSITFHRSLLPATPLMTGMLYLWVIRQANDRQQRALDAGKPLPDRIRPNWALRQLVLFHNAFLAVFSAWSHSNAAVQIVPYFSSALLQGGVSGLRNAFCTVPTSDPAGLGRFVWWFYISKYYEIIDSIILIAKGKRVSNLQAYHHAGAIAAMWSGCRFSAPGIWIFLLFNSGIHTMMYTYYTLSALGAPGASALRQAMTTAQITQLFVGLMVACLYLILQYSPASFNGAAPSIGDVFASALNPAAPQVVNTKAQILPTPAGRFTFTWDKLRASNNSVSYPFLDAHFAQSDQPLACCASTGHLFATILNIAYLVPLIVLFVRFYLRSYCNEPSARSRPRSATEKIM